MPIFDITFSTPLDNALRYLAIAVAESVPVSTPRPIRSSIVSKARYGLTAAAP